MEQMANLTPQQLEEMSKMALGMAPRAAAASGASTSGDSSSPMAGMPNGDMMNMMEEQVCTSTPDCVKSPRARVN
jgi:hypothetical protein